MTDDRYTLVFDEAQRAITQQEAVLDGLRSRAGTLVAVAAITTSFLGGLSLDDGELITWTWIAMLMFFLIGILVIAILWPYADWVFRLSPERLLADYVEANDPADMDEMHRELAMHLEANFVQNEQRLNELFWLFRVGSGFLVVEVLAWLLDLAGG